MVSRYFPRGLCLWKINIDKCPSYNSYQGNMDENDCSTYYNATCPGVLYKSPSSVLYTGCYIKELIPTKTTTTPSMTTMKTETMITKTPTTSKKPSSDQTANYSSINENMTQTNNVVCECGKGWMIAFLFILLLAVLIAALFVFYKIKLCDKCKQKAFRHDRKYQNADSRPQDSYDGSNMPMV